ncbi:uncharacterized protein BDR25DRAFT_339389 [Lindgomyces ingoldianus]|uniref:Uncharacterized protein n=1 Tax=Lindgomyces ingoldianus TaxID=673940 RepID=A0ACB6RC57_9PLEO|nr:uncharacterized protein BDR25DRAFT_339389 [Lindgomyces ingoldianus]KAF2476348.1 hypothetical protein BDR25DRAFT_339389 [Lindgomyces ingoldianus]
MATSSRVSLASNLSPDPPKTWTSARKRISTRSDRTPETFPQKKRPGACPRTVATLRTSRQPVNAGQRCPICLEDYFDTPLGGSQVISVKLFPFHPDSCDLCAYWERAHIDEPLLLTVRAREMTRSIHDALIELAEDDDFFKLSKSAKSKLLNHVQQTLTKFEWQYHPAVDLAEFLDPFLLAVDTASAYAFYGLELKTPAPDAARFPPREYDLGDCSSGQEPWIAGFFRQWALEYEQENGEAREGWGEWAKKRERGSEWSWDWPYKRIVGHKVENGKVLYRIKWVGKRFGESYVGRAELGNAKVWRVYDRVNGVKQGGDAGQRTKRRKTR